MAWSKYQMALAVGMVITGSINTLATKWADLQSAPGCNNGNTDSHRFNHPFLQAVGMFIGEFSCLVTFQIIWFLVKRDLYQRTSLENMGNQDFKPYIFLPPALCDMAGTSLMYVGLNYTYASSFQMLRGAIIVFTAMLSVAFLRRVITNIKWLGIFCVIVGLVLVGMSDILFPDPNDTDQHGPNEIITGDLIIIMAQIIGSAQMVLEEKFVSGKNINPLQAVGWEGFFGMTILGVLLVPMYFIKLGGNSIEDAPDGLCQLGNNWKIALGTCGSVTSIAFFNFFGISVTKEMNATTRMVLDSVRTLVIWVFSLAVGWEIFQYLQLIGFVVLIIGMGLYNGVFSSLLVKYQSRKYGEVEGINAPTYEYDNDKEPLIPSSREINDA